MTRRSWLIVAAFALFLHGGCCLELSPRIRKQAENLPRMTCAELVRNGPGKNQFLKLTDVRLCSGGYAFYRDMDAAMEMFIPIYSSRLAQEPPARELTLLLNIEDDRDRERLLARPDVDELICELWWRVDQLEPWVTDCLAAKYPGIRFRNCRVVSVGLHEPTPIKAQEVWWYGIVSFLLGGAALGLFIWLRVRQRSPEMESERLACPSSTD